MITVKTGRLHIFSQACRKTWISFSVESSVLSDSPSINGGQKPLITGPNIKFNTFCHDLLSTIIQIINNLSPWIGLPAHLYGYFCICTVDGMVRQFRIRLIVRVDTRNKRYRVLGHDLYLTWLSWWWLREGFAQLTPTRRLTAKIPDLQRRCRL